MYLSWKQESPPENTVFRRASPFFDPDIADYPTPAGPRKWSKGGLVVHDPGGFFEGLSQQAQVPQQTGTPPKQTVQAQPAWQQAARHSQQPWVSLQQSLSPDRQVMHTPFAVGSQVQLQKQRLHWATQIPFFVHAQLHIPSARLRQRFWSVPQEA